MKVVDAVQKAVQESGWLASFAPPPLNPDAAA